MNGQATSASGPAPAPAPAPAPVPASGRLSANSAEAARSAAEAQAAAAALPPIAPPPPRDRSRRRHSAMHKEGAGEAAALTRAQAAASASAAAAAAAGAAAAASPVSSVAVASLPYRWRDVLSGSHSFVSSDGSFPWEVEESRPAFQRFLAEHFRPLATVDLIKIGIEEPRTGTGQIGRSEGGAGSTQATSGGRLTAGTSSRATAAAARARVTSPRHRIVSSDAPLQLRDTQLDVSMVVPPLGVRAAPSRASPLPHDAGRESPEPSESESPSDSGQQQEDILPPAYMPSIAQEPEMLLQLGIRPAPAVVDAMQEDETRIASALVRPTPATPVPAIASPALPTGGIPVHVLVSTSFTGRPSSSPAPPPMRAATPGLSEDGASSVALEGIADLPPAYGEAQHVMCEFVLSVPQASAAPLLHLSTLLPTQPPPSVGVLSTAMPEVRMLAAAREEQLEQMRRKRTKAAEQERRRKEEAEERKALEAEQASHSRKQSTVTTATAAAAATTTVAAAADTPSASPAPSPDVHRMEIDGEPITSLQVAPPSDLPSTDVYAIAPGFMSLPLPSVMEDVSPATSPLPRSRVTTPSPSDPDQLLKELLSLQLQLTHQVASNALHRERILSAIGVTDLQAQRAQQYELERHVHLAYQGVARWQSIRSNMRRGTCDVLLPPALLAYHRQKYRYDGYEHAEGAESSANGDVYLDTSSYRNTQSDVQMERALTAEAYALDDYSVCSVCFATGTCLSSLSDDDQSVTNANPLVFCEVCNVCVHLYCYGLASAPEEGEWRCQWCQAHPESSQPPPPPPPPAPKRSPTPVNTLVSAPAPAPAPTPGPSTAVVPIVPPPPPPVTSPMALDLLSPQIAAANLWSSFFPGFQLPLFPMTPALPTPSPVDASQRPDSRSSGDRSAMMDVDLSPQRDVVSSPSPMSPMPNTGAAAAAAAATASTAKSQQRAQARKQAVADRLAKKQREREQAEAAERARVEEERLREVNKRAERRQREQALPLPCCLCTVRGGALKPTDQLDVDVEGYLQHRRGPRAPGPPRRLWAHIVCALWLPRTFISDMTTMQPIRGVKEAWQFRAFKHGLPPAAIEVEEEKEEEEKGSKSEEKSDDTNGTPALSANAYALPSRSQLPLLSHMNPLDLLNGLPPTMSVLPGAAGPPVAAPVSAPTESVSAPPPVSHMPFNHSVDMLNALGALNSFSLGMGGMGHALSALGVPWMANFGFNPAMPFNLNFAQQGTPGDATAALQIASNTAMAPADTAPTSGSTVSASAVPTLADASPASSTTNAEASISAHASTDAGTAGAPAVAPATAASDTRVGGHATSDRDSQSDPSLLLPLPALPDAGRPNLHSSEQRSPTSGTGLTGPRAALAVSTLQRIQSSLAPGSGSPSLTSLPAPGSGSPSLLARSASLPQLSSAPQLDPVPHLTGHLPTLTATASTPAPLSLASKTAGTTLVPTHVGVCGLCKKSFGCCVFCSADVCTQSYHPLCAWYAGLYMRIDTARGDNSHMRGFLYCSMHTPLHALSIELVDIGGAQAESLSTTDGAEVQRPSPSDGASPDKKRRRARVDKKDPAATPTAPAPAPAPDAASMPSVDPAKAEVTPAPDREETSFPWVTLRLDPTSRASVSEFISLYSYRNKVRLLQQREYRNRGRQEQTKRAKMHRKKRRLRLYGPQPPTHAGAVDGASTTSERRRHVRTNADGTPIFDRSTRGESKLHPREDQYELGRCAVCFHTDEEIKAKEKWEADKIQRDWQMQCQEALALGYAPPPRPMAETPAQPAQGTNRRKSLAAAAAAAAIPPHVTAFHASNPILRCCECEIEVHSRCYTLDHQALVRGRGWTPIADVKAGEEVWSLVSVDSDRAAWSRVSATVRRPLQADEPLYLIQSAQLNTLTNKSHMHWHRDADRGSKNTWSKLRSDEVWPKRTLLPIGAASIAADYRWSLASMPFLPPRIHDGITSQLAWCRFLGLCLNRPAAHAHGGALVQLRPSDTSEQQLMRDCLAALGWLVEENDAMLPSTAQPHFRWVSDAHAFVAECAALHDYLLPMADRIPYEWLWMLSAAQARHMLAGWLVRDLGGDSPDQSFVCHARSASLRDDFVTLAALAGWQASYAPQHAVETHCENACEWTVQLHTSIPDHESQVTPFVNGPQRITPTEHQQTEVVCLTVPGPDNFLVRRVQRCDCSSDDSCTHRACPVFSGNCYGVQYDEVQPQLQALERRRLKLQRVVRMGEQLRNSTAGGTGSSVGAAVPFSAHSLQHELDELQQQFEDELAEELEEAEDNTTQWRCRRCLEKDAGKDMTCALCGRRGGAFKRTDADSWVHLVCAQWIPELSFVDNYTLEPVTGLDDISPARRRLKCYLCRRAGPCIECSEHTCSHAFHPLCGMLSGQLMLEVHDSLNSSTFLASCRRHTPLHLARFLPLPHDYTVQVWEKKKVDNARSILEMLRTRGDEEAAAATAQHEKQQKAWANARKEATAPVPRSRQSTPSQSPTPRRRGANRASAASSASTVTDPSASPLSSPAPLMAPPWPNNASMLLDSICPGMSAAQFTLEFYRQLQAIAGAQIPGLGPDQKGGSALVNANANTAAAAMMAAAASSMFPTGLPFGMPPLAAPPMASRGAPLLPPTAAAPSSSPPSTGARRSTASSSPMSSPVPPVTEEDDLPLSTILAASTPATQTPAPAAAPAAAPSSTSRPTQASRRAAAAAAAAMSNTSSAASSPAASPSPSSSPSPSPTPASSSVSARKRKSVEDSLVEEAHALVHSKRVKPDTPHATLSAASAANAAAHNKAKGRTTTRHEEKEHR